MMSSNKTCLIVPISDIIISEGLPFNLTLNPRFKNALYLARNFSKWYNSPNRNLIAKDVLDFIHDQNMKSKLSMIKREWNVFSLLFLGYSAAISIMPLLNILVSHKKHIAVAILELVRFQGHLANGDNKYWKFICNRFLEHILKLIQIRKP